MVVGFMKGVVVLSYIFCQSVCVFAQTSSCTREFKTDSIVFFRDSLSIAQNRPRQGKPFFSREAVRISLAPALFLAASGVTWDEKKRIRTIRNRYLPGFRNVFDDYMQYAPAVAVYGMKLAGMKGRNGLMRTALSHGAGLAVMAVLVNTIKYTTKVERPDGSTRNSFPSGHTAMAFANATVMHKEYGLVHPIYSVAGYSGAAFTALGRSLNNRHWMPDLLAGAGIGILSTQLGYFFVDKIYKNKGDNLGILSRFESNGNPSFLAVKLGNATPMRNMVGFLEDSSYTKAGFEAGIEGAWFLNKHWGIGGEFSFMSFPVSASEMFPIDENDPDIGHARLLTQSIGTLNLGLGPYYALELTDKWLFMAKADVGLALGAKGKMSFELDKDYPQIGREVDVVTYTPHTAWRAGIGSSITYKFYDEWGLSFYTHYNYSNPTISFEIDEKLLDETDDELQRIKEKQVFDYLGIGLRLTAFF